MKLKLAATAAGVLLWSGAAFAACPVFGANMTPSTQPLLSVQNSDQISVSGGCIDGTAIGSKTPSTGAFTTLSSTSAPTFTSPVTVANGGTGAATETAHGVLLGQGTSAITAVSPGSTSGVPLIAQGASSDPVYGTALVAGGGTGLTSGTSGGVPAFTASGTMTSSGALTANGVVLGGGAGAVPTATAAGTAGQFLIGSAGAPAWATPASAMTKPANPSAVSPGTSTAQMLGLAANANPSTLTPVATGRVHYDFDMTVLVASTTNGATFQCSHGTGSAPANAASVTGTQDSSALAYLAGATTAKATIHCSGTITGLALSTAVWFDVAVLNTTGSQAVTVTVPTFNAFEY